MTEIVKLVLTKFTDETITIFSLVLLLTLGLIVIYWLYNRRRFQKLRHQIPASVVKNYLDSIIQNSTALKSSLFRGGGMDLENVPSVFPTSELPKGDSVATEDNSEQIANKNAEISSLKSALSDKEAMISELERNLEDAKSQAASAGSGEPSADNSAEVEKLQNEIVILKEKLKAAEDSAASSAEGGGEDGLASKLDEITKERDELKERLMEYEIIEEDLANLKRLQQENDQLKKTVAELKGGAPAEESAPEGLAPENPAAGDEEAASAPSEPEAVPEEPQAAAPEEPAAEEASPEKAPSEEAEPAPTAEAPTEEAPTEEAPAAAASESSDSGEDEIPDDEVPSSNSEGEEQKSAEELLSEFEKMLG